MLALLLIVVCGEQMLYGVKLQQNFSYIMRSEICYIIDWDFHIIAMGLITTRENLSNNNGFNLYSAFVDAQRHRLYSEGEDLTKHHQCVAPTWVMHGSQSAPECSPHTSLRCRVRELMTRPIIQEDDQVTRLNEPCWAVIARIPGNPLLFAISALGSFMTSVSQDLGFTLLRRTAPSTAQCPRHCNWESGLMLRPEG